MNLPYIYLGVYLTITNKNVPSHIKELHCVNNNCTNKGVNINTKFCPYCGEKTDEVTIPKNKTFFGNQYLYNIDENIMDRLNCVEVENRRDIVVLIPNIGEYDLYDDSKSLIDISSKVNIERDISKFKKEFNKELSLLKDGNFYFEIHWGFVNYYN